MNSVLVLPFGPKQIHTTKISPNLWLSITKKDLILLRISCFLLLNLIKPNQLFQFSVARSPSIHAMSWPEESLEMSDSELLPCSCWASWKLHSMAINVLGPSKEDKNNKYFFTVVVIDLINNLYIHTIIHVTWSG